ncbi:MAG: hypothetical protein SOZ87_11820, partial [Candidatus Cryptobacteroides sp.]|nr:hypothetical protein [Candidatus Cryptobacteroides sp.]
QKLFVYFCSWLRATIYEYRKHKIVIINELSKPLAFFISIIFHLRNLSYIDSLGYVTYFDKQQGSIGYNNATDYSVFYTKE